jgi:hypothetical protein
MYTIELDFVLDSADELGAWLAEYAPGVSGRVLDPIGPAGGNAVVELRAASYVDLAAAITVYDGGGGDAEYLLSLVRAV